MKTQSTHAEYTENNGATVTAASNGALNDPALETISGGGFPEPALNMAGQEPNYSTFDQIGRDLTTMGQGFAAGVESIG
ncbi:hypothetical protein [Segnochrobactrum spirostomi]|uniref:Uncharacterized protein n=1 Tax=Segnochrobactrum spirostomi TaxID=2608987 RepID=A0A6A7Y3U2_9HYPH|nr:hypothetical protein [Segnochrobactrum spirostomi]MQT13385.1 hypothetical protein [Segnochrobactrum spirostomi]